MLRSRCIKALWSVQEELLTRGVALTAPAQNANGHALAHQDQRQARSYGGAAFRVTGETVCRHKFLSVKPELIMQTRTKIKKAQKQKGKAAAHKVPDFEMESVVDMEEFEEKLDEHLTELREEYINNLAVTANIESFENLKVQTKAGTFPLNNVATVIQKSPSLIIIDLQRSPQYMADVNKALQKSQSNLNPQQSSPTSLAINLPKVSRERREQLAKSAKTLLTGRKAKINKVFDEYTKLVTKNTSDKDLKNACLDTLLQLKKKTESKAEDMMKAKQQELLKEK